MEPFAALRQQARDRRDKLIDAARTEYSETLVKIASLENDLLGRKSLDRKRTIIFRVRQLLPVDRPFSMPEVIAALEAMDDRRDWHPRHVSNLLAQLRQQGYIRRLRRPKRSQPAVYLRTDATADAPAEAATLKDRLADLLEGGSMTQTELAVALIEGGYETEMSAKALRAQIGTAMREDRERFRKAGARWAAAQKVSRHESRP